MARLSRTQAEKDRDNAARRRRYALKTRAEKDAYNKVKRAYHRYRYTHDQEWRAKKLKQKQEWVARKRARCPLYVKLERAQSKQEWLRSSVQLHQRLVEKYDRQLVEITFKVERLRKECKGK